MQTEFKLKQKTKKITGLNKNLTHDTKNDNTHQTRWKHQADVADTLPMAECSALCSDGTEISS